MMARSLSQHHRRRPPHPLPAELEIRNLKEFVLPPPVSATWSGCGELGEWHLKHATDLVRFDAKRRACLRNAYNWVQGEVADRYIEHREHPQEPHGGSHDAYFLRGLA